MKIFNIFSEKTSEVIGSSWAFITAVLIVLVWLITGPIFHFSDTWQIVINTLTTIITFLIVFLIQNTQNRSDKEVQIKLDELIKAIKPAKNSTLDIAKLSNKELRALEQQYEKLAKSKHADKD